MLLVLLRTDLVPPTNLTRTTMRNSHIQFHFNWMICVILVFLATQKIKSIWCNVFCKVSFIKLLVYLFGICLQHSAKDYQMYNHTLIQMFLWSDISAVYNYVWQPFLVWFKTQQQHTHDFMFTFFHIEIFHSRMLLGEITEICVKVRDKFKRRCYVIIINLILRGQKMTSQLT